VGLLAAALWLVACEPAVLVASATSISFSIALSEDQSAHLNAKLTPTRVTLRPGEEVSLELELHNTDQSARVFLLAAQVDPPHGVVVTLPAGVTVPKGKMQVRVRVGALPSVIPGRYEIEIRIRSPDEVR
jgi:uncharacterized membrane protein